VISFGGFVANTGDIEGRLAAFGAVTLGNGFSIGDKVNSALSSDAYSVIAGSLSWGSGSASPSDEKIFVATNNVNVPSYLQSQIAGPCDNCLESVFQSVFTCYSNLQSTLANLTDNMSFQIKNSGVTYTCNSTTNQRNSITVTSDVFNLVTYSTLENCNLNGEFIINVEGNDDVIFHGASFPANSDNVVYNILGSHRTIFVQTAVNGAILAPSNFLNQTGGVIRGKVVVGDVFFSLQINQPNCNISQTEVPPISSIQSKATSGADISGKVSVGLIAILMLSFFM